MTRGRRAYLGDPMLYAFDEGPDNGTSGRIFVSDEDWNNPDTPNASIDDHISSNEIAALLEKYSHREVEKSIMPLEAMRRVWKNKEEVPEDLKRKSAFPDDFWILARAGPQ
ncbi:hypothetical protein Ao3042_05119 [Aspergillus oryzae 3.042]|uniref:Uncharacterized protein n=1 Tax=Aspergillus oryzae (strain 3.042) TaxID=1160506 RepID=I8IVX5_ASPO3|nr:hypothetical protein Ao3042_05119 [Aspergillus oryzae 3.042]|eukprot:EIT83626.1 hypothetical protein Ao3042_05119 [Aspergillus oryzae 3.042]